MAIRTSAYQFLLLALTMRPSPSAFAKGMLLSRRHLRQQLAVICFCKSSHRCGGRAQASMVFVQHPRSTRREVPSGSATRLFRTRKQPTRAQPMELGSVQCRSLPLMWRKVLQERFLLTRCIDEVPPIFILYILRSIGIYTCIYTCLWTYIVVRDGFRFDLCRCTRLCMHVKLLMVVLIQTVLTMLMRMTHDCLQRYWLLAKRKVCLDKRGMQRRWHFGVLDNCWRVR